MTRLFCFIILCLFASCQQLIEAPVPSLYWNVFDSPAAKPLSAAACKRLEGIYQITASADDFGDSAIIKTTYDIKGKDTTQYISFFCKEDVRFFIMQGKSLGDSVILNGYWRNIENTKTGKAHFIITNKTGAFTVQQGTTISNLTISGVYGMGNDEPEKPVEFVFRKPLKQRQEAFYIIAHRGGGRNNDLLPASENSLEMIHLASAMGANAVEIDVQLTSDSIPVLYHDERINDRLTHKSGIRGTLSDYSYAELSKEINLKRGGKIPTLQDALHTIVYNTPLEFVWLDCKTTGSLHSTRQLQATYTQKAADAGRKLLIVIGVPDEKVMASFTALPNFKSVPSLCEMEQDSAVKMGAKFWATSWTKGLQTEEIVAAKNKGMQSFAWTLDVPRKIKEFMREGHFHGIVTNRPSAVAYEYYSRQ